MNNPYDKMSTKDLDDFITAEEEKQKSSSEESNPYESMNTKDLDDFITAEEAKKEPRKYIYSSSIKDLPKIAGQQLATLADAASATPRWLLNKAESALGYEKTKPLSSNFESPKDYAGKAINKGLEWAGDTASLALPGGAIGKIGDKVVKVAPKIAKKLGSLASFIGNAKSGTEAAKLAAHSVAGGATAETLENMGMNPIAASLLGPSILLAPSAIKYGKNSIIKYFRKGDITADDIKTFNEARIASGETPVKFGIADAKSGTKLSIEGVATKHGYAQKKAHALEETITENSAPLESYFENGMRESAPEIISRGRKKSTIAGEVVHYESLLKSLYSKSGNKEITKFGNSFNNIEDASHAMKSLINNLSPTGDYLEIARNFYLLPSETKRSIFKFMPAIEKDKLNSALRITERMAPILEKEALKKEIKSEGISQYETAKRALRYAARATIGAKTLGLSELAYLMGKKGYKSLKKSKSISDFLHVKDNHAHDFPSKYLSRDVERSAINDPVTEILATKIESAKPHKSDKISKYPVMHLKKSTPHKSKIQERAELIEKSVKKPLKSWGEADKKIIDNFIKNHPEEYKKFMDKDRPRWSDARSGSTFSGYGKGVPIGLVGEYSPYESYIYKTYDIPMTGRNPMMDISDKMVKEINLRPKKTTYVPTKESLEELNRSLSKHGSKAEKHRSGGKVYNNVYVKKLPKNPEKYLNVFLSMLSREPQKYHARR